MKYKEVSQLCSKGCGRPRIAGQRYCREHRAQYERERRRKQSPKNPCAILDRASQHLAQECRRDMPHAEFKALMDARALLVRLQMDALNNPWMPEAKAA